MYIKKYSWIKTGNSLYQKGFTLIELLVVLSIISLLASIVLAPLNSLRSNARVAAGLQFDAIVYHTIGDNQSGEWLFNEGTGAVLLDSSGNAHAGTAFGSPTWLSDNPKKHGYSMSFNGSTQSVHIGSVTTGTDLTYSVWIKVASIPASAQTILWDDNTNPGGDSWIELTSTGAIRIVGGTILTSTATIKPNEWTNIVVSQSVAKSRIYIDGALAGASATGPTSRTGLSYVSLGASFDGLTYISGGHYFAGQITGVRVYNAFLQ